MTTERFLTGMLIVIVVATLLMLALPVTLRALG